MEYEEVNEKPETDPRLYAIPDIHGHAKGEHKAFIDERPIPLSARMLFLWFYHACRRGWPRFMMVTDHMNYLTFEDPAAINLVRRALKLAQAGDLYGAAETASVEVGHAAVVSEGLRRGMRYSIGAEVDNDPRSRPDAQNIVDAMKPDGMIRSVHFLVIDHPTHGPNWNWPFDNPEFADVFEHVGTAKTWELYMTTLLDALERLPGNIIGHFYVPALFGHWPADDVLDGYENALVDACEARGIAIEFNTRFLYRNHTDEEKAKYLAAHRRLLTKCKAKNVGIAIGSDAHSPKDQGGAFRTVLALLDECAINELVFPIGGRLLRVALRVDRKADAIAEPVLADDRKPARKARPSAAPDLADDTPAEPLAIEETAPSKSKSRPKRGRARTDETQAPVEAATLAPGVDSDVAAEPARAAPQPSSDSAMPARNGAIAEVDVTPAPTVAATKIERKAKAPVTGQSVEPPSGSEPLASAAVVEADDDARPPVAVTETAATELEVPESEAPEPEAPELEAPLAVATAAPSAEAAPIESLPVESSPAESSPAESLPAESSPAAESLRVETPPDKPLALESLPVEVPADESPLAAHEYKASDEVVAPKRGHEPQRSEEPQIAIPIRPTRAKRESPKAKLPAAKVKPPASAANAAVHKAARTAAKPTAAAAAPAKKAAAAKKTASKKPAPKKATAARPSVKKAAAKKATLRGTAAKKSSAKKAAAKKATPKKPAQRRR